MVQLSCSASLRVIKNVPTRFGIAVLLFFACFFSYMLRVNMSINILAMVQHTDENGTVIEEPYYGPRYAWTPFEQSLLLGSFFWGYAITSIPTGILCQKYGGKNIITYQFASCVILTALTPVLAEYSVWISFVMRFLIGFASGGLYPAMYYLMSMWAPPMEKGIFTAALVGNTIGTVTTWPFAGWLIEEIGWDFAFYAPAILTLGFAICWFFFMFDSPASHPRITAEEKEYIETSLIGISRKKSWPPMLSILISIPFWALLILHFGSLWGLFFLLTGAPKFMNEVLKFNLSTAGFLASLPYLARFFAGLVFGPIGDYLLRTERLSATTIRKVFCIFSHVIPGIFLICIPYVSEWPYVCVTFITLSLGMNGASTLTNLQNSHDLAPNYASTLFGIINTAGTTAGFITPLVVSHFTEERNTIDEWNNIFIIGAAVYILPAVLFMIFGSGSVQPWNAVPVVEENFENAIKPEKNGSENAAFEGNSKPNVRL